MSISGFTQKVKSAIFADLIGKKKKQSHIGILFGALIGFLVVLILTSGLIDNVDQWFTSIVFQYGFDLGLEKQEVDLSEQIVSEPTTRFHVPERRYDPGADLLDPSLRVFLNGQMLPTKDIIQADARRGIFEIQGSRLPRKGDKITATYRLRGSRSDLIIVKKDEKTSHLIDRNPGRAEFASILRFVGQEKKVKYPTKGTRTFTFAPLRLVVGFLPASQPMFRSSLDKWQEFLGPRIPSPDEPGSSEGPEHRRISFSFLERVLWPKGYSLDVALGLNKLDLPEPSPPGEIFAISEELRHQIHDLTYKFLFSSAQLTIVPFPRPDELLAIDLKIAAPPLPDSFVIRPASVIAVDFLLQGQKKQEEDNVLVEAIRQSRSRVVLGSQLEKNLEAIGSATWDSWSLAVGSKARQEQLGEVTRVISPQKEFLVNSTTGLINIVSGNQRFVDRVPLFLEVPQERRVVPSFSLIVSVLAMDQDPTRPFMGSYEKLLESSLKEVYAQMASGTYHGGLSLGDVDIPCDSQGILMVNFTGSARKFSLPELNDPLIRSVPFYSFFDNAHLNSLNVDGGLGKPELIPEEAHKNLTSEKFQSEDCICLLGPFERTDFDMYPTPLSHMSPFRILREDLMGVEIHANVIQNILESRFLNPPRWFHMAILVFLGTILLGFFLDILHPTYGLLVSFAGLACIFRFSVHSCYAWGQIFPISPFFVSFPLTWGMTTLVNYLRQRSRARETKAMFSRFVAPEVVSYLTENPEAVKPGGQKTELTIFFSDLAGFTTISESLTPEDLVVLMNEYLGEMTDVLFRHGGTLDKYIGDAVMAYWNFPRSQPDHAIKACLYTLEAHRRLGELQADWGRRGLPKAYARAGMNTAKVVVGCMGSSKAQMNFTCLGDGVNLAARLEGANKEYGTLYMISDATYQQAKGSITGRFLDFLAVKGKKEPVKVHELVSERGNEPPGFLELQRLYDEAIQLHLERKFDPAIKLFQEIAIKFPDDGPTQTYLHRCLEYKENPPPENWDGRYILTHK